MYQICAVLSMGHVDDGLWCRAAEDSGRQILGRGSRIAFGPEDHRG